MATNIALDLKALRSNDGDAAAHLLGLRTKFSEQSIADELLDAVNQESAPPIVFAPFCSMVASAICLKTILVQDTSKSAQRFAAKALGKKLGRPGWKQIWDDFGGVGGLVEMMAELSVDHVRVLVTHIGLGHRQNEHDAARQTAVTDLYYALCSTTPISTQLPAPVLQNTDQRPLLGLYLLLLPSCSDQCVRKMLDMKFDLHDSIRVRHLLFSHTLLMQQLGREGYLDKIEGMAPLLCTIPNRPGSEPGFTAPMTYTLSLVEAGVKTPFASNPSTCSSWGTSRLLTDLIQNAYRRRVPYPRMADLIKMAVEYYTRLPRKEWDTYIGKLLEVTTRCWAGRYTLAPSDVARMSSGPRRAEFEGLLERIFTLTRPSEPLARIANVEYMHWVPRAHLYTLLRMQLKAHAGVDVEDEQQLAHWKLRSVDSSVLQSMDKAEAATLLKRLLEVKQNANFFMLSSTSVSLLQASYPEAKYVDACFLLAELQGDKKAAEVLCMEQLEKQKQRTTAERDAGTRASHAELALWIAVQSGSLLMFEGTLIWLRRFLRDPLTMKKVFCGEEINTTSVVELLAAVPRVKDYVTIEKIEADVKLANKVCRVLIDIMKDSMREPSFSDTDWRDALRVVGSMAFTRIDRFTDLEKEGQMTFRQIEDTIWQSTRDLLLDFERMTLDPSYKILRLNKQRGPLSERHVGHGPLRVWKELSKDCLKAMDHWATLRDELWRQHRKLHDPNTTLVAPPFTQGLPIQFLMSSVGANAGWNADDSPYTFARAQQVVFMAPQLARAPVPSQPEMRRAIDDFVDYPGVAVEIFINGGDRTSEDMQHRFRKFWLHWMHILESDGMSQPLAEKFLRSKFQQMRYASALPKEKFLPISDFLEGKTSKLFVVALPEDVDGDQLNEWEPLADQNQPESIIQPPTTLDCFLAVEYNHFPGFSFTVPRERDVTIPARQLIQDALSYKAGQLRKKGVFDAVIAVSVLYLDAKRGQGKRLLSSPFPSAKDPRFPSLYLEEGILEQATVDQALRNLKRSLRDTPATLLLALTNSYLETLSNPLSDSPDITLIETTAFRLLSLLAASDRPEKAFDLITRTILDQSDASSWHRQLLGARYMRSLSVIQVRYFLSSLTSEIVGRLQDQAKQFNPPSDEAQQKAPRVKITTVKQIAQMLRSSTYVPVRMVIDIMSELLTNSTHVDARVEAVETLFLILPTSQAEDDTSGDDIAFAVIEALSKIVPSVAAVGADRPISEHEWEQADSAGEIPERFLDLNSGHPGPLLRRILLTRSNLIPQRYRTTFVQKIVIPSMEISTTSRKRGFRWLLEKYGLDNKITDSITPFNLGTFSSVLREYRRELPSTYLDAYHRCVMFSIQETTEDGTMNKLLEGRSLQETENIGKFLRAAFLPATSMNSHEHFYCSELLNKPWEKSTLNGKQGITIEQVQKMFSEQLSAALARPHILNQMWNAFVSQFGSVHWDRDIDAVVKSYDKNAPVIQWQHIARPMLDQCIASIDNMRTTYWQRNPDRKPATLPSSFRMRTFLLPYTFLYDDLDDKINVDQDSVKASLASAPQTTYANMAHSVRQLLGDIVNASGYQMPFEDLEILQNAVKSWNQPSRLRMACILGRPSSLTIDEGWTNHDLKPTRLSQLDMYCIHVADEIFGSITSGDTTYLEKSLDAEIAPSSSTSKVEMEVGRRAKIEWGKIYTNEITVQVLDVMNIWMGSAVEELRKRATNNLRRWKVQV